MSQRLNFSSSVVPYVGTWIEIASGIRDIDEKEVVPYVGTWIEISAPEEHWGEGSGRALRGTGDRNMTRQARSCFKIVVPYVGTWIEILEQHARRGRSRGVVPYVGTWIEMLTPWHTCRAQTSRSLRGNVDRNTVTPDGVLTVNVVPYVGTWIEMPPTCPA